MFITNLGGLLDYYSQVECNENTQTGDKVHANID